ENAFQFTREVFPLDRSMKVVEHRRSATEQELAESRDLGVEHPQETRLDKIDPRIFEEALVIERQDDGIFDLNRGCRLYPPRQVLFGGGTVDKPRFAGEVVGLLRPFDRVVILDTNEPPLQAGVAFV